MKSNYLLPHRFKTIGWIIFVPAFIAGLYVVLVDPVAEALNFTVPSFFISTPEGSKFIALIQNNLLNEICGVTMTVGSILVAFSKEKDEDELISSIRLSSLVWATWWNYALMLVAFITLFEDSFYLFMIFNMYTILLLFIVKFHWNIWKLRKSAVHEE